MNRTTTFAILVSALVLVGASALAQLRAGTTYDIDWHTIDGGGGTSTSATFELSGTIGQPDAGEVMTGGAFEVAGGFWMNGPVATCLTDIANNDGLTNVFDLLELLANWGTDGNGAEIAEPNDVVNVFDLLELLSAWGACE